MNIDELIKEMNALDYLTDDETIKFIKTHPRTYAYTLLNTVEAKNQLIKEIDERYKNEPQSRAYLEEIINKYNL
jgi:hypothetical protein